MHRTDFKHIQPCGNCHGTGEVMGAAMRIHCHVCSGIGFMGLQETPHLTARKLQLAKEVRRLAKLVDAMSAGSEVKSRMRQENNKGPGGSNFTGD